MNKQGLDAIQAVSLVILAAVGLRFGLDNLFGVQESTSESATAEILSHDGVAQHQFQVYLCVDPGEQFVDGTVIFNASADYMNLALPAEPSPETSLGFFDQTFRFDQHGVVQLVTVDRPQCLLNDQVARLAAQSIGFTDFAQIPVSKSKSPGLPPVVTTAQSHGFPYWTQPTAKPVPLSFRWQQAIQKRSWSERFLRLDFATPLSDKSLGQRELPTDVWVYFPVHLTPVNSPTSAVYSAGRNGYHALDVHVQPGDVAIEVDWVDEGLANQRDWYVLLLGVAIGVIGGIAGGFVFASPRWDDWILGALWPEKYGSGKSDKVAAKTSNGEER